MRASTSATRSALAGLILALAAHAAPAAAQDWMPPGADDAVAALNESPRHGEWQMVRLSNGDSVRSWVVYPEASGPAPVVVVIHEIYGLTNWVRSVADQLAADGFIAIAPDLLTGRDIPTDAAGDPERQAVVAAIRELSADVAQERIRAVAEHAMSLPAAMDRYFTVGYCWGGAASFEHATRYSDRFAGAAVYYGSSPSEAALANVRVPVLGLYGGDDERVNSTIPRAQAALGSGYRPVRFPGAGHGFLRAQDGRDGANLAASRQAWPMTIGFFHGAL